MRIVVHGQQAFGKAVLEALLKRGDNVVAVYVAPEKPGAKPDPLKEAAVAAGLRGPAPLVATEGLGVATVSVPIADEAALCRELVRLAAEAALAERRRLSDSGQAAGDEEAIARRTPLWSLAARRQLRDGLAVLLQRQMHRQGGGGGGAR